MQRLSVAIITFNEERNIRRCLESVNGLADEIVVVDSFSTDGTADICAEFGATFIENPFAGHIEQKNFAVSQCSNELVLALDADEALSDVARESVKAVKEGRWAADGYIFNRANYYCGKHIRHCGWYPDPSLRLWARTKGSWGGHNPHDKFSMHEGCTTRHLDGDLLHFSYYSIEDHVSRLNTYSTISAASKFDQGIKSNFLKMLLYPSWRFFRDYIIKLGFLDGYYGLIICVNSAHEVFQKYVKLAELWRGSHRQ